MKQNEWPSTIEEIEDMAQAASIAGFLFQLYNLPTGWGWFIKHTPTGIVFEGDCDSDAKPVAFVCALIQAGSIIVQTKT